MIRKIVAVILGYLALAACVFAAFSGAYLILGTEGAFRPGTYEVSGIWIALSVVVGAAAAVVGGFLCAVIARDGKPVRTLAAMVFALGVVSVAMELRKTPAENPRPASLSNQEAMMAARQPLWIVFLNPLLGVLGVLAGGRLRKETGV